MLEDNMSNPNALPCVPFRFNILPQKSLTIARFRQHTHIQKLSYDFDTLDSKGAYAWTARVPWSIFFVCAAFDLASCAHMFFTAPLTLLTTSSRVARYGISSCGTSWSSTVKFVWNCRSECNIAHTGYDRAHTEPHSEVIFETVVRKTRLTISTSCLRLAPSC